MTVKELKEELNTNKYDDNMRVFICTHYGEEFLYKEIIGVYKDILNNKEEGYTEITVSLSNEDY